MLWSRYHAVGGNDQNEFRTTRTVNKNILEKKLGLHATGDAIALLKKKTIIHLDGQLIGIFAFTPKA